MFWLIFSAFSGVLIGIIIWAINSGYSIYAFGAIVVVSGGAVIRRVKKSSVKKRGEKEERPTSAPREKVKTAKPRKVQNVPKAKREIDDGIRSYRKYILSKIFKVIALLLPILFSAVAIFDRELNALGLVGKEQGWVFWVYAAWMFCTVVLAPIGSITSVIQLFVKEKFYVMKESTIYGGYYKYDDKETKRKFTVSAISTYVCVLINFAVLGSLYMGILVPLIAVAAAEALCGVISFFYQFRLIARQAGQNRTSR